MFSLTVNQRGLEAHAAFRNLIQVVEQNGVMHQGLGPGGLQLLVRVHAPCMNRQRATIVTAVVQTWPALARLETRSYYLTRLSTADPFGSDILTAVAGTPQQHPWATMAIPAPFT